MKAVNPWPDVPGDNKADIPLGRGAVIRENIMARSGTLVGMNRTHALWRFGFTRGSEAADAFRTHIESDGFLWVLATRKTGKIKETTTGFALELPDNFSEVMEWEPD